MSSQDPEVCKFQDIAGAQSMLGSTGQCQLSEGYYACQLSEPLREHHVYCTNQCESPLAQGLFEEPGAKCRSGLQCTLLGFCPGPFYWPLVPSPSCWDCCFQGSELPHFPENCFCPQRNYMTGVMPPPWGWLPASDWHRGAQRPTLFPQGKLNPAVLFTGQGPRGARLRPAWS